MTVAELAIDTCFAACSVSVRVSGDDGSMRQSSRYDEIGRGHAETLIGMLADVAAEADVALSALSRIIVTVGPGTFTGVRVGIASAQGLVAAGGGATIAVSSLAAIGQSARRCAQTQAGRSANDAAVAVVAEAGRGAVYWQVLPAAGGASAPSIAAPELIPIDVAAERAKVFDGRIAGPGISRFATSDGLEAKLLRLGDGRPVFADACDLHRAVVDFDLAPTLKLRPFYLREADAAPSRDQLARESRVETSVASCLN